MKKLLLTILFLIPQPISCSDAPELKNITLSPDFSIEIYATGIQGARAMTFSDNGTLFVCSKSGNVYAITKDRKVFVIDRGLKLSIGIDFYDGDLYVSDLTRIRKYEHVLKDLKHPPTAVIINDSFPGDRHHGGKFMKVGPDKKLYVTIGAPCNVCLNEDERYAAITRIDLDGGNFDVYAKGVRNSVGFDWHPVTGELWFTDNGIDWLGDEKPPDELNRAERRGQHFGFPFVHGKGIHDPYYWGVKPDTPFTPPAYELPAHVASLGMRFYTGELFPEYYKNGIFIAEHGSWNRTEKTGYRVSFIKVKNNKAVSYEIFASGWLQNGTVWGRPADVEVGPDGSLYVSDDNADVIYRISYDKKAAGE